LGEKTRALSAALGRAVELQADVTAVERDSQDLIEHINALELLHDGWAFDSGASIQTVEETLREEHAVHVEHLREEFLRGVKAKFDGMKKAKNYWIERLQAELNALELDAEMAALEAARPSPVPQPPRSEKKLRLIDPNVPSEKNLASENKLESLVSEIAQLRERNSRLEKAKLTKSQVDEIKQLKEEYVALKRDRERMQPAPQESVAEYERRMEEAMRTRDEALERLRTHMESAKLQERHQSEQGKIQVQRLEEENLMLYKRIREMGGFPALHQ
jgi:hypothetical protein